ncbi:MAG: flavodoxin [Methanobrevibacter sp.]|jgi:flavodoxin|nr:flavodoxin [Methanobrevibacter sp.]
MKILLTYYSRTRVTAGVAKAISQKLNCDVEEIKDTKDRSGAIKYLTSCIDALRETPTVIEPIDKDILEYDLVIVGSPVWAATMANPVLAYLTENKDKFKELAFFCTCSSSGYEKTIAKMEEITGKSGIAKLFMTKTDIDSSFDVKVDEFIENINEKNV